MTPSTTWIRVPTQDEILDVARRMRAADGHEIAAGLWDASPEAIAHGLAAPGLIVLAAGRSRAEAIVAIGWRAPRLVEVGMFASDAFPEVALCLTRHLRRVVMPALLERGVIRAECRSIEGHVAAHRWLLALGARPEALLEDCGKNRERFVQFAWTRTALEGRARPEEVIR